MIIKQLLHSFLRFICTSIAKIQIGSTGHDLRVNFPCRFTKKTFIGNGCNFNGMKILGDAEIRIGDFFHSGTECMIISSYHNYDKGSMIPYDNTYISKNVTIEPYVWLGNRVMILGGVTIGEGAIIQAGSVVVSNIPPYAIAGGHPAKVFSHRDVAHFKMLKDKEKFF